MLRALLAALVVANLVFFAYTRGYLDPLGLRSTGDREPERLANQLRPQSIRLLPMSAASSAVAEPAAACLETPAFTAAEAPAVESVLAASLPTGAWVDIRGERASGPRIEVTHVYRVASADAALAAKLSALKLDASGRGFSACAKASR